METFTPDEITKQSKIWFDTYAGTYSRLLKRTKAEANRAFIVFCELMLMEDYRDVKGKNKKAFIESFMNSNQMTCVSHKSVVDGSVEYQEIISAYLD